MTEFFVNAPEPKASDKKRREQNMMYSWMVARIEDQYGQWDIRYMGHVIKNFSRYMEPHILETAQTAEDWDTLIEVCRSGIVK